jgi:DNA-binding transcriptional regulator PaaX
MPRAPRVDYADLLDVFCFGRDKLTRPTFRNLLAGYEEYAYRKGAYVPLEHLQRKGYVNRAGRGQAAAFTITAVGRRQLSESDPMHWWGRRWDGSWRVVTFDLPESRRNDRHTLWKALRARKLGFLQRSVWVWPHNLEPILQEIIHADGVPECFCGFEVRRLFLCTSAELVETAWDFAEIGRRQTGYLQRAAAMVRALETARGLANLATTARAERHAYQNAFSLDPLLPRSLWPAGYAGPDVQSRHVTFRAALRRRFAVIARGESRK